MTLPARESSLRACHGLGCRLVFSAGCPKSIPQSWVGRIHGWVSDRMESWDDERNRLQLARDGDREAFDRVAQSQHARLCALVNRRLQNRPHPGFAVEDVCQETFLRAYRSVGEFVPRHPDSFFRWLATISRNVVHEFLRRDKRKLPAKTFETTSSPTLTPSHALRRAERYDRLQLAIERLEPDHREVIRLVRLERLSCGQAGARMGRSDVATRSLLWRALRALKEKFGDTESLTLPQDPPRAGGKS